MEIYQTFEYQTIEIPDFSLTAKDKEYLASIQLLSKTPMFTWLELKDSVRFEFSSWVGVLELEQARIVIKPKFNRGFEDVIDMLLFTEDLPLAQQHATAASYDVDSLMELLVRLYVKEVESLLQQGVRKEYVNREENLSLLRGRIDMRQHMNKNPFTSTKLYCSYDELDTNIIDNQVIRMGLELARKFTLSKQMFRQVNRVAGEFAMMADSYEAESWPHFTYNRLNKHYEKAHKLAYYIWRQQYINNVYRFETKSHYSFLLDMNELFEDFITVFLQKYCLEDTKITGQRIYKKAIMKDGSSYHDIRPDILVETQKGNALVLDTKYKPYGQKKVANSDIYQLLFYAQFVRNEAPASTIIFPQFAGEEPREEVIQLLPGTVNGRLYVKSVNIEAILAAVRTRDTAFLQSEAERLITER